MNCPPKLRHGGYGLQCTPILFTQLFIFSALLFITTSASAQTCNSSPDVDVLTLTDGHQVIFKGKTVNGSGSSATSSWTYCIKTAPGTNAVSHFVLGQLNQFLDCIDNNGTVLDPGTIPAGNCAENNDPVTGSIVSGDPTTGVYGIKWDCGLDLPDLECVCVTFELDANYADDGMITAGIKYGPNEDDGMIQGPNCLVVLPVEMMAFEAKKEDDQVVLEWATASEINNRGFEIQRSKDALNWESIDFIKGAGTTYEAQHYSYLDVHPQSDNNYYRLKQVDFDGRHAFSSAVHVRFNTVSRIGIFSNPVRDHIRLSGLPDSDFPVELFDNLGRLCVQKTLSRGNADLDVQDLPPGSYFLRFSENHELVIRKVLIMR